MKCYGDSAETDLPHPAPLSNLAVAIHESGQYEKCIDAVNNAFNRAAARAGEHVELHRREGKEYIKVAEVKDKVDRA